MTDELSKHAHFRISQDVLKRVAEAAQRKGLGASGYMRMAILERLEKDEA